MNEEMTRCIETCLSCYKACVSTAMNHCLEAGGKHVETSHLRLMMACAEICGECARDCRRIGDMDECVAACEACAASCQKMAAWRRPAASACRCAATFPDRIWTRASAAPFQGFPSRACPSACGSLRRFVAADRLWELPWHAPICNRGRQRHKRRPRLSPCKRGSGRLGVDCRHGNLGQRVVGLLFLREGFVEQPDGILQTELSGPGL